jgi:hypothetical protein
MASPGRIVRLAITGRVHLPGNDATPTICMIAQQWWQVLPLAYIQHHLVAYLRWSPRRVKSSRPRDRAGSRRSLRVEVHALALHLGDDSLGRSSPAGNARCSDGVRLHAVVGDERPGRRASWGSRLLAAETATSFPCLVDSMAFLN